MSNSKFKSINFKNNNDKDFAVTLRKRVDNYFSSKKIDKTGDYRIWIKVVVLPLMYFLPFAVILSNVVVDSHLITYGLWVMMGVGIAGCGLGIMHDANHGALSKNKRVNNFIGFVINFAGGYALNWKIQHNVLHHTYTNIDGYDEDIDPSGLMRFSPNQPHKSFYKYQVVYAWFLYGLMTLSWATNKDFAQIKRYNKMGLVKAQGLNYKVEFVKMVLLKVFYYAFFIGLPLYLTSLPWYHIVLGWLSMHFTSGLILGCVFQPAHCIPETDFPIPDTDNTVEADFLVHQMHTTANFAPNNRLLSWYVGGLNFQIEHHLFPNISHVHHKAVSKIVQATAKEFSVPYYSHSTFRKAILSHAKMLLKLSKA